MPFGWHEAQTAFVVAVELTAVTSAAHGAPGGIRGAAAVFGGFGFGGAVGSGTCHPIRNAVAMAAATGFMPR